MLVDGPARVALCAGKAEAFGFQINANKVIIREGKRLPFAILETAAFEIALGEGAAITEVEGDTIPLSWRSAKTTMCGILRKPAVVMVVGGIDSGKSSFCTYIANKLVNERCIVAVLDEDLGQSDIGPPCTVAYALLQKPVTDLFNLSPENAFFVGATTPSEATEKTIQAVAASETEIQNKTKVDFIIVNTDGWVSGEAAVAFKQRLAEAVNPDIVFYFQDKGKLSYLPATMTDAFCSFKVQQVNSPGVVKERDRESRKTLRELGFAKYLENARVKVFSLSHIIVEGAETNPLFRKNEIEGTLVGLHGAQRRFLGIGVIRGSDTTRKALKILTAVPEKPSLVVFGKVRLDANLREIQE